MAHGSEKRTQLRGFYVYQRMAMEVACLKVGIPKTTANRWKKDAKEEGDDWDAARAAIALGDDNFKQLSIKLLEDYLIQHQATMQMLKDDKDKTLTAMQRADILASMGDSFHKTMASFKRISPELNRQAIGLDVLRRLAQFAQVKHPKLVPALLELLEPFGEELARAYG